MTEIILEPNYQQLYQTFRRESHLQAEYLNTHELIHAVLELVVPINICLQAAPDVATVQDMREWLGQMVADLRKREHELAEAAEDRDRRMAKLNPGSLL